MGNRRQDAFGIKAKKEGYVARSVYKLSEIDRRVQLIRRGNRILDLGAAPGSWTQYCAQKVGPAGYVLGIDLEEQRIGLPKNVEFVVGDIFTHEFGPLDPFDVVLSDMAPGTSGQQHVDQYRSFQLVMKAIDLATTTLKPGGHIVTKIFQGPDMQEAKLRLGRLFEKARIIKPDAVRKESYELFLVGLRFKGVSDVEIEELLPEVVEVEPT